MYVCRQTHLVPRPFFGSIFLACGEGRDGKSRNSGLEAERIGRGLAANAAFADRQKRTPMAADGRKPRNTFPSRWFAAGRSR